MFGVIIGAACVAMVLYLVPGLMDNQMGASASVYATVREPGALGRLGFGESTEIKMEDVTKLAQRQLQQQHYPDFLLPYMMQRAGQVLVQRAMLKQAADAMRLEVSDADLARELRTGPFAEYLFPDGQYIGDDRYMDFVQTEFNTSRADFESQVKDDMELQRLQAMVTGGAAVTDAAVREAYRVQGTKVQFDYAAVSLEELKKTINPTDAELQNFFKQNAAKYAKAIPETRKIEYAAFDASKTPGGKAAVSDAEAQAYYNAHLAQYKTEEQVKTRHILIAAKAGADAKTDAAAKAKAEDVLKQLQAGGKFAELAKKYSDDPGSKDKGGEYPLMPTSGFDPAYAKAAMALNPGQTFWSGTVAVWVPHHPDRAEDSGGSEAAERGEGLDREGDCAGQAGLGVAIVWDRACGRGEEGRAGWYGGGAWTEGGDDGLSGEERDHRGLVGWHADAEYGVHDGEGRGAAGDLHRRRLRGVYGGGCEGGARSGVCGVSIACAGRLPRPEGAGAAADRDDQTGCAGQGAERPEEGGGGDEAAGEVERTGGRGRAGDRPGRDERAGSDGVQAGQGRDLECDQRRTDGRGADGDRQAGAHGGGDSEELRCDAGAVAEPAAGGDLQHIHGDADRKVRERRRSAA